MVQNKICLTILDISENTYLKLNIHKVIDEEGYPNN